MGYSPSGRKELDTTERLTHTHTHTHTHTVSRLIPCTYIDSSSRTLNLLKMFYTTCSEVLTSRSTFY